MEPHHWPLYGLRLTTPRLELTLPDLDLLDRLASVAAGPLHDPSTMPFTVPWTDAAPAERGRATFQHVLRTIAEWTPRRWTLSLVVRRAGQVVGRQDISATDFEVTRETGTGSWLGMPHQGEGLGTEMRAAVAHLAFAGLGAHTMTSAAAIDNKPSLGVSRRLGYRPDGLQVTSVRGRPRTFQRLRLDRAAWAEHRTIPVEISGLERCLPLFGA